ncbi:hypothetical protein CRYUN_Cryun31cG0085100 [Craigia yunnanensis]
MEDNPLQTSLAWLQDIVQGAIGHGLETRALEDCASSKLKRDLYDVISSYQGADGNWHVGAIATLIDVVGAAAVYSFAHRVITSLDFSISYYSTGKIQV